MHQARKQNFFEAGELTPTTHHPPSCMLMHILVTAKMLNNDWVYIS